MSIRAIYGCYNKDKIIREKSSSGGIFYLFAKKIIEADGVVFGAAFDEDFEVVHSHCSSPELLEQFMGSKYVQSAVGDSYSLVKNYLENGRYVLFSGTPCQVAGLDAFLGKKYEKLTLVDFICHGVPSRRIWREYKNRLTNGRTIESVNFRDKEKGWRQFSLKLKFQNGGVYRRTEHKDPYLSGFLQNLYLRPSCYECPFKTPWHVSDITLGDFWSAETFLSEQDDDRGLSVVLIQSKQGEMLFNIIKEELVIAGEPDIGFIKETNSALVRPAAKTDKRRLFYDHYKKNFKKTVNRLTNRSIAGKIIRRLNRLRNG